MSFLKQYQSMIYLIIAVSIVNWLILTVLPFQKLSGDELDYIASAHQNLSFSQKALQLIPGNMPYSWWPPFPSSLYALFASDPDLIRAYHRDESTPDHPARLISTKVMLVQAEQNNIIVPHPAQNPAIGRFVMKIAVMNLIMYVVVGVNIFWIGLLLKCGKPASLTAAGIVWLNPNLVYYINALWPETLHLLLLSTAVLCLLLFDARAKMTCLAVSGFIFGFCALTKGVVGFFLICLIPLWIIRMQGSPMERFRRNHILRLFKLLAVFYGSSLLIVLPQMITNRVRYDSFSLASNTWINIECGIIPSEEANGNFYERYFQASTDSTRRESLAKERVKEYLRRQSVDTIVVRQFNQFFSQQLNDSFLDRSVEAGRWGDHLSGDSWVKWLTRFTTFSSWAVFFLGLSGLAVSGFRSFGRAVVSIYLLYYLGSLLVVGFNPRFFIQAIPFLSLYSAAALTRWKEVSENSA